MLCCCLQNRLLGVFGIGAALCFRGHVGYTENGGAPAAHPGQKVWSCAYHLIASADSSLLPSKWVNSLQLISYPLQKSGKVMRRIKVSRMVEQLLYSRYKHNYSVLHIYKTLINSCAVSIRNCFGACCVLHCRSPSLRRLLFVALPVVVTETSLA